MRIVQPEVYLIGYPSICRDELCRYLVDTDQVGFLKDLDDAFGAGVSEGEALCSFYAKLCYSSLVPDKNENLTGTRNIVDNVKGCFDQGHGSVFEHANINFVATNVSRVFTHELVRHRAGAAFSQTSGRYVRKRGFDFVDCPDLADVREDVLRLLKHIEWEYVAISDRLLVGVTDRDKKKQLTSALRRLLPNGQANEIGFTLNIRALRHTLMMRTAPGAEREIRLVFGQVYRLVKERFPLVLADAEEREADGLLWVAGMKMQPYDRSQR